MSPVECLFDKPVNYQTLYHAPAFTAQRRAHYLHLPGRQVAKAILLAGSQGPLLAVLPATHQIDTDLLAHALGGSVRLANEAEIAERFPDCEWGVVPPFGAHYGLSIVLEDSVAPDDLIAFETTARAIAVRMRCADFEHLEKPRRLRFAREVVA
jgi:Ala-tRNA(Pro) deacylase